MPKSSLLLGEREFVKAEKTQFVLRNRRFEPERCRPIATRFDDGEMVHEEVHYYRKIEGGRVIKILVNYYRFPRNEMRNNFVQHFAAQCKCFSDVDKQYLDRLL